jgi:hypothetical protein
MPCFHPVTAWRSKELNANGKRPLVFDPNKGLEGSQLLISCNQCSGCRYDRSSAWGVRLVQESKFHLENSFLTLTLDNEHLPHHGVLVKRDVQLFFKRLRKAFPNHRISYYSVGEYGDKNDRPHYHAICFGLAFLEDRRPHSKNQFGDQLYTSATLDRLWGKGTCLIGAVSQGTCNYVAGYIFKKINGNLADIHYRRIDPQTGEIYQLPKEFSLISTRPAIGLKHYERYRDSMYARGSCIVGGQQVPIPKYYDRKLGEADPLRLESIKTGRFEDSQKPEVLANNSPERLAVREEVFKAQRKARAKREL